MKFMDDKLHNHNLVINQRLYFGQRLEAMLIAYGCTEQESQILLNVDQTPDKKLSMLLLRNIPIFEGILSKEHIFIILQKNTHIFSYFCEKKQVNESHNLTNIVDAFLRIHSCSEDDNIAKKQVGIKIFTIVIQYGPDAINVFESILAPLFDTHEPKEATTFFSNFFNPTTPTQAHSRASYSSSQLFASNSNSQLCGFAPVSVSPFFKKLSEVQPSIADNHQKFPNFNERPEPNTGYENPNGLLQSNAHASSPFYNQRSPSTWQAADAEESLPANYFFYSPTRPFN